VILTHSNIVSTLRSILPLLEPNQDDVYIAYLPLAHVLEITGEIHSSSSNRKKDY
jgi:long-subunit acyl-CoA synthetase (AMP-forming)